MAAVHKHALTIKAQDHRSEAVVIASQEMFSVPLNTRMQELTNAFALAVLGAHGGNKTSAAESLGISRRTMYNIIERLERK